MSNTTLEMPFDLKYINSNSLSFDEAKEYLLKYFIVLNNGGHAMLRKDGTYNIMTKKIIDDTYLNRVPKNLKKFYNTENYTVREIAYELNKDTLYENYLNMCPKMKHKYIPYDSFEPMIKENVNKMCQFIKEIINNNSEDAFQFIMKWLSNMVKGNKNESCIYLKGIQGIGKSSFTEFIKYWVIGEKLCLETGSTPLKEKFNSILEGKLMVVFEELENVSAKEWISMSSNLKRIITAVKMVFEQKNINSYEAKNINNYFINSNNDAIKDDQERRYFIADVSTKKTCDDDYFGALRNCCFNDEVGQAFYCYLMEIDTDGFKSQKYPITQSKKDSIVKRLDTVQLFLKEEFIMKRQPIKHSLSDLFQIYDDFVSTNLIKGVKIIKIDFNKKMKEQGFEPMGKHIIYDISIETLNKVAKKKSWIHDTDGFDFDDDIVVPEPTIKNSSLFSCHTPIQKSVSAVIVKEETRHDLIQDYDKDELIEFLSDY